jgi:hypothetical protein
VIPSKPAVFALAGPVHARRVDAMTDTMLAVSQNEFG